MIQRLLNLPKSRSFFLFGARGVGKTELLKQLFTAQEALTIDLLDPELVSSLSAYPNRLLDLISAAQEDKSWIVIDEIQKVPALLDIVHKQISDRKFKFALTGSSSRKLKRGAANLLAGRASIYNLYPLTHLEIGKDLDLSSILSFGSLPEVYGIDDIKEKRRFLKSYAQTYLMEEIIAEQIVRNLPPFRRFLEIVGRHSTEIISYTNIAKDIDSDPKTVQRYYEILEDTLLGFFLPSYDRSIRKQQRKAKKFYFFDNGISRVLSGMIDEPLTGKTFEYGQLFENFVVNEIYRLIQYSERQAKLSFLRISDTIEIDLIVEIGKSQFICEIKSTERVDERHARNLQLVSDDFKGAKALLLSQDPQIKQFGSVRAVPWSQGILEIAGAAKLN